MKRRIVKRMLPLLMALTLAATTVCAKEADNMMPGAEDEMQMSGVLPESGEEGAEETVEGNSGEKTADSGEVNSAEEAAETDEEAAEPVEEGNAAGADETELFIFESETVGVTANILIGRPDDWGNRTGIEKQGNLSFSYQIDDHGRAKITGCEVDGDPGAITKLELPLCVDGEYPVFELGAGALQNLSNLEEILLPYYVRYIPSNGFYGCTKLKKVIMPRGIELFYKNAFHNVPGFTIYGVAGTYAETRAKEYNIPFVARQEVLATKLSAPQTPVEINQGEHIVPEAFCTVIEPADCTEELQFVWPAMRVLSDCNPLLGFNAGRDTVTAMAKNVKTARDVVVHGRLEITQHMIEIAPDETLQLGLTYDGKQLNAGQAQWGSWHTAIASVQNNGLLRGRATGETYISASYNGETAVCRITVAGKPQFTVKGFVGGRTVSISSPFGTGVFYSFETPDMSRDAEWLREGEVLTFDKSFYGTIYARGLYDDGIKENWSDVSQIVLKIPEVKAPVITQSGDTVTIRTATPSCTIYYTTDGSTPTTKNGAMIRSSTYSFFAPKGTSTIKAIAVRSCFANSAVTSKKVTGSGSNPESASNAYNVSRDMGVPSFTVKGVIGGRNVTFKSATAGSKIYFSRTTSSLTTDDECVQNGGTVLFENYYGTIYARAYKNGVWSNVARLILKIPVVNKPTVTRSGEYVTLKTTTPNCTLYYTTDGSNPSPDHGTKINGSSGSVKVKQGTTVKVIAVRSCFTNSQITVYK